MKFSIIFSLFAYALAAPNRNGLPRLPSSVVLNGHYSKLTPMDSKIVGGKEVVPNSLPFQVSLQRRGFTGSYSQSCGGSILNENTILNAAHCVNGVTDVSIFRVVAGEHSLTEVSGLEQSRDVSSYYKHEQFVSATFENDIALLYLATPLDLSVSSAKPVILPAPNSDLPVGTVVSVSGWGTTRYGGSVSNVLLSVDIPVVSDSDCNSAYAGPFDPNPIYPSVMLCAGAAGIDSCQGDSGGPLFTGSGETAVQHGIVSFGPSDCGSPDYPGVYTQVSSFLDWIATNSR